MEQEGIQDQQKDSLTQLAETFRSWRAERKLGSKIPDQLWDQVCKLEPEYGFGTVANACRVNYVQFRHRLGCRCLGDEHTKQQGTVTTAVMAQTAEGRITLYFTGAQHAGENLRGLLDRRDAEKSPPVQMSDALSRNIPADYQVILCNCLAHCRKNFFELFSSFPQEVQYVINLLGKVYQLATFNLMATIGGTASRS